MIEWSEASKYSSFNSYKGLCYYEHYKTIMGWMDGGIYLPPPVEVNIDPYAECQLRCGFCVTQRYLRHHREEVGEMRSLPTWYLQKLIRFLGDWGVSGICLSGGGEPTLHEGLPKTVIETRKAGMDAAVVTNMVTISDGMREALMECRWVAMSVDAGTPKTYETVKGKDCFKQTIKNIELAAKLRATTNAKVDLAYKMVVLPENINEIWAACHLAKELGVQDFHVRPVDMERDDIEGHRKLQLNMKEIQHQFDLCHCEETKDFHVYTVVHKFDKDFHNIQPFKRCLATPLLLALLTDGCGYLCVDVKMMRQYKLGSAFPEPEAIYDWWGRDAHRDLIKSIIPSIHCKDRRCTFSQYNLQVESIQNDSMCLSFP